MHDASVKDQLGPGSEDKSVNDVVLLPHIDPRRCIGVDAFADVFAPVGPEVKFHGTFKRYKMTFTLA